VVFEDIDLNNDAHSSVVYILRHMYKSIILEDLDYALDKKVEQELWNLCFKIPVSRLQASSTPSPAVKKKPDVNNPLLSWFLESAAGFYLVLLQEICTQCNLDTNICKSNTKLGIFNGPTYPRQPKNESCLYIIQHCLIHLGDLARYRKLLNEAEGYYKQVNIFFRYMIISLQSSISIVIDVVLYFFRNIDYCPFSLKKNIVTSRLSKLSLPVDIHIINWPCLNLPEETSFPPSSITFAVWLYVILFRLREPIWKRCSRGG